LNHHTKMHNKLDYNAILRYFTHNEWKYIIEVIDREYHDFGHNELNRSVSNKLEKLTSKWDNQNEEETIIKSYYKQLNDKDVGI